MPYAGIIGALVIATAVGTVWATAILAATSVVLLGWNWRLRRGMRQARRVDAASPFDYSGNDTARIEEKIAALNHRLSPAHPISGLPMREALIARMTADQSGMLGALAFADFDRLTAFDPALGERVFAASIARLRQMLPPHRCVAQVDRGHVGLWFGDEDEALVRAELDAITYALGEAIEQDGSCIVPEIKVRFARFDATCELEPNAFLARTLASFATPDGAASRAVGQPMPLQTAVARDRYALEQDLRQAIARRELRLDFQPLVDAGQGRVCGAEALIRWDHPERGPVSPALFVPIMETIRLESEIGMWALNAAMRSAHDWYRQGLGDLRVAVNVSGLQLERDDLPILIERTLQRHELGAAALEIELTESIATSDATHCRRIFQALRAMGVKLAVDDFGTGYSGFSSLRSLAFDKIKIDREFVTDVDTRRDSQAICQSIIALGRGLGIRVLAEGVERREEYAWLRRHGCQHFQGYYFGRPMRSEAFVAFVRDASQLTDLLRVEERLDRVERV